MTKRSKLIKICDALMFCLLKERRGEKCEICGRTKGLGTFHIMPKSTHRRLRYSEENILLVCWFPCHHNFHSNPYKAIEIIKRIEELRGKDFKMKLTNLNALSPTLKTFELEKIKFGLEQTLRNKKYLKKI